MSLREELSGGVELIEPGHKYRSKVNAKRFKSVSKVIDHFREPFDREGQSRRSAAAELKRAGERITNDAIEQCAAELRIRWDDKMVKSQVRGTAFHKSFEDFDNGLQCDPRHMACIQRIHDELYKDRYHEVVVEGIISSNIFGVAGTSDKICQRAPGKKGILDISDYKTNEDGISLYSPYSKYFINGLGHLEDCKYTGYALQLSLYAFMALSKGYSIGRLSIVSVPDPCDPNGFYKEYPVPFMMMEAKYMLETVSKLAA